MPTVATATIHPDQLVNGDASVLIKFAAMMKRRHEARYFGFDLLSLNGELEDRHGSPSTCMQLEPTNKI